METHKTSFLLKQGEPLRQAPSGAWEGTYTCHRCRSVYRSSEKDLYMYRYEHSAYGSIDALEVVVFCPSKGCDGATGLARKIETDDWELEKGFPVDLASKLPRSDNPQTHVVRAMYL